MHTFTSTIQIIDINPYVLLPEKILQDLFKKFGNDKGQIPVSLIINDQSFRQTLVKYAGEWRLYLNLPMRKAADKNVGDRIKISIDYDDKERTTLIHQKLKAALQKNKEAKQRFNSLSPSRQKEIARYINNLKSEEAVKRNVERAINFLSGTERFIGRDKP